MVVVVLGCERSGGVPVYLWESMVDECANLSGGCGVHSVLVSVICDDNIGGCIAPTRCLTRNFKINACFLGVGAKRDSHWVLRVMNQIFRDIVRIFVLR